MTRTLFPSSDQRRGCVLCVALVTSSLTTLKTIVTGTTALEVGTAPSHGNGQAVIEIVSGMKGLSFC